jgi:diacylglycerol O-acyltransferase / wax synthase
MDRLSALDAFFLFVEDGTTHMHIASCASFEGPAPPYDRVVAAVAAKLPHVPRYRQRVRFVPLQLGRPVWVDDPHFRLEYHLRHTALPAPGGRAELDALMGRLMSQELDRHRPLWEAWMVEGVGRGRWALITKIHHAMADGVAGNDLLAAILDLEHDAPAPPPEPWCPRPAPSDAMLAMSSLGEATVAAGTALGHATRAFMTPARACGELRSVTAGALSFARRVPPAPSSGSLTGPIGPHRRWTSVAMALDDLKAIRARFGGTVNDVVLAAVTGGLRTFLLGRDEPVDDLVVRTLVPVSVRAADARGRFDNRVSGMVADLPVGVSDPVERLMAVREQMASLKQSHQTEAGEGVAALGDLAPSAALAFAERAAMQVLRRAPQHTLNAVATNVPGPQFPLYLAGREMLDYRPFVPIFPGMRIGVAIVSYNGRVGFGLTADYDAVPDLDVLAAGIETSIAELLALAGVAA